MTGSTKIQNMTPEEYSKHMEEFLQRVRDAVAGGTSETLDKTIMTTLNKRRHRIGPVGYESMEWKWATGRDITHHEYLAYCFGKAGVDKEKGWLYFKTVFRKKHSKDATILRDVYDAAYDTATFDPGYRFSFGNRG